VEEVFRLRMNQEEIPGVHSVIKSHVVPCVHLFSPQLCSVLAEVVFHRNDTSATIQM